MSVSTNVCTDLELVPPFRDPLNPNLDATIIAEAPKLLPYCKTMKENISSLLEVEPGSVNIKATTNEGIGGIGRGEAIAAICVVSLVSHR